MLIEIGLSGDEIAHLSEIEFDALENLGISAFQGHHLVGGSRQVLQRILELQGLSNRAKSAFRAANDRAMDFHALKQSISRRILATRNVLEAQFEPPQWHVPLRRFSEQIALQSPALLAENLSDARFYCELADKFRWHCKYRSLCFSAVPVGGGGSTTSVELRERIETHPRFTLCIVDSDREFPEAPLGNTAASCLAVLPTDTWHGKLKILWVRELENLLPQEWLCETTSGSQNPNVTDTIRMLDTSQATFLRRFCDFKSGFTSCELISSDSIAIRALTKANLHLISMRRPMVSACIAADSCALETPCFKQGPLGHTLPTQAHAWLSQAAAAQTHASVSDPILNGLAEEIFQWGIAAPKTRL
jgi:hypothetical protein